MIGQRQDGPAELAAKIARLIEERGWNQADFVRNTGLNQRTVRLLLQSKDARRLRNDTISRCAKAFGLSVHELRSLPVERLLLRLESPQTGDSPDWVRRLYEQASQPELQAWLERNPERAKQLTLLEIDELLSLQGTGGPLTRIGVQQFVELLERKRKLIQKVHAIAGTEYLDVLEKLVGLMYEKIQPYAGRS